MNTAFLVQSTATSVVIYLELAAGGPATGLVFSDVTAGIKKDGAGSFSSFTLTAPTFSDLGSGFYEVDLGIGDTDTLGNLYLRFSGATIKSTLFVGYVTADPLVVPPVSVPPVTAIFGYIYNSAGVPVEGAGIVARVVQMPYIVPDGILVGSDFITTTTDEDGFFTISLLSGAQVEFIITDANYRRTVTIPGSTANLFDIP